MVILRKNAGAIEDPKVHSVGVIALGSHLENHGPALPIDTDAKIAAHIAFQSSLKSGAKFLGIIYPAHELDEINHGVHVPLNILKNNIINTLKSAQEFLQLEKIVIVNGHGGNLPLMNEISSIEEAVNMPVILNNEIVFLEGPHGGTGELSMGKVLGILDQSQVVNQCNLDEFEEVGLYGFTKARENDPNIDAGAKDIEENGVFVDEEYGNELFNKAINSVLEDIKKLIN